MSFYVWCEIVCAKCSRTCAGTFATRDIPRKSMSEEAKKRGWVARGENYFCPFCELVSKEAVHVD